MIMTSPTRYVVIAPAKAGVYFGYWFSHGVPVADA